MSSNPITLSHTLALRKARKFTMTALGKNLSNEQLAFQIAPGTSHILFLIGHIAWSTDMMLNKSLTGKRSMPDDLDRLFSFGSKPIADAAAYPALEDLLKHLDATLDRATAHLETVSDKDLSAELPEGTKIREFFGTLDNLLHMFALHEAYHAGQITMLRRAQGLEAGFGM